MSRPAVVALGAPFLPRVGEPDTGDVEVPWRPIVLVGLHMLSAAAISASVTWVLVRVREPA